MTVQTESTQPYEVVGHFTKDEDALFVLISNLIAIISERNADYLPAQV
jgi:hypothetical protein